MTTRTRSAQEDPRSWAEERIAFQAECLRAVVSLIERKVPLAAWPRQELSALVGALQCDGRNDFEDRKARDLERHLFRGDAPEVHV